MKKNKMVQWIKAIFGKCTYAAERAYETQMEQWEMRAAINLPPLPPPPTSTL
jgi:2-oxo-4-hydroxy-4-carboxy--5-ureidoimidazoline (OHCU) decarboxylase